MIEIVYPVWRQRLAQSLHINRSHVHAKYYQVATICANGRPKNRTMVFRGFLSGTQSLLSVTDLRSEKVLEWQAQSKANFEICWYFSDSREQFRLAGEVALISVSLDLKHSSYVLREQNKQSLLKQQWSNLSTNARKPFFASSPKAPFDEELMTPTQQYGIDKKSISRSDVTDTKLDISKHFCVVVFIPKSVDYLDLKSKPQQRCLYDIQDGWKEKSVNP
jgi:PPOX class probable FMN-dependent enzyme